MLQPWEKSAKWSLWVKFYLNFEAVELTLTNWHSTRLFKMVMLWRKKKLFKVWQNRLEISFNDGLLRFKQIPALSIRLLSWKPDWLHYKLLQINPKLLLLVTKHKHKPQHQKLQALHLEYNHPLKLLFKDKDLQHLIQLNCWSVLAVTTNGWKATWLIPSVIQNTKPGSETWSWIMLPDKPLRETSLLWTIGGKTNQKKRKPLFIVLLFALVFHQPRSNQGRMKTYSRFSQWLLPWLLDYALCWSGPLAWLRLPQHYDFANTRLLFWLLCLLWPCPLPSTSFLLFEFSKQDWWSFTLFTAPTSIASLVLYFEGQPVYVTFMALRLLHINNFPDAFLNLVQFIWDFAMFLAINHFSTLDPLQKILWRESIPGFENLNKSMMDILFFQNWLFDFGHTATISSYGHLSLFTFEENDTGLWNMHWSNCGNLNWIFRLFLNCLFREKELSIDNPFPTQDNLVYVRYGGRKDGNTLERTSKKCWTLLCFSTELEFGPYFKTWAQIHEGVMNKPSSFVVSTSVFRDAMHFDAWDTTYQRLTNDWHCKQ